MKSYDDHPGIVVGQIDKSATEIVRIVRTRFDGAERIHLPVFCISGRRGGERGICLTVGQWLQVLPMIQEACSIQLPKPAAKQPAKPKR